MSTEYNVGWLKDNENQIFIPFTYAQAVKLDKDDTRLDTVLSATAETIKSHGDTISNIVSTNDSSKVKRAEVADKTQHPLKFGTKSFDGSEAKEITADDLGITKVLTYLGISTAEITDGGTENPKIGDNTIKTEDIKEGSVVLYKQSNELYEYIYKEFIWNGSNWEELGDENSYAFKSVAIVGGEGLSGGGDLSETTITLNADVKNPIIIDDHKITLEKIFNSKSNPLGQATDIEIDNANTISIPHFEVDEYGRITSASSHTVKLNLKSIIDAIGSLNSSLNDTASDINESIRDLQGQIQSNDGDITELQKGLQKLDENIQENIDDIIEVNTTQNDAINTLSADVSELHSRTKYLNARDEDGTFYIVDKDGNIIFKVDDNGTYSTDFTAALNVDGEITTITSLKTLDDTLKNTKIITDLTSNDTTTFSDINKEGEIVPGVRGVLSPKNGGTGNELGRIQAGQHQDEAIGKCATSEGKDTIASGDYSHAEGYESQASGDYSHAEGNSTVASNYDSHAEGYSTVASGDHSHAEGNQTIASGQDSHTSGYRTIASGKYSSAFGVQSGYNVTLSGDANSTIYTITSETQNLNNETISGSIGADGTYVSTDLPTATSSSASPFTKKETNVFVLQGGYTYTIVNSVKPSGGSYFHTNAYIFGEKNGNNYLNCIDTFNTNSSIQKIIEVPIGTTQYLVYNSKQTSYKRIQTSSGPPHYTIIYRYQQTPPRQLGSTITVKKHIERDISLYKNGYIIYGNDKIIKITSTSSANKTITLEKTLSTSNNINNGIYTIYLPGSVGEASFTTGLNSNAKGDYQTVIGQNNIPDTNSAFIIGNGPNVNEQSNAYIIDWNGDSIQSGTNTSSDFIIAGEENIILSEKLESLDNKDTEFNDAISAIKDKPILVNLESNESNSYNTEEEYVSPGVNGILQPENGGTGNTTGRVQIGQKDGQAIGTKATSEGNNTIASGNNSHAEGYQTIASDSNSHAEGTRTIASGYSSHAEGFNTIASKSGSHAEGGFTVASGDNSHAEGDNTIAFGSHSHAEGYGFTFDVIITGEASAQTYTLSTANANIKTGQSVKYNNNFSKITEYNSSIPSITLNKTLSDTALDAVSVEIYRLSASGSYSHAEGFNTVASGLASHAEGENTVASNNNSHAEGENTVASGHHAHAEGDNTVASGQVSHAEGYSTVASGHYAHAEGFMTEASGFDSHAEGSMTEASGNNSHAEGSMTEASGQESHAEGFSTVASGHYAHAEGSVTEASGQDSHAEGFSTEASGIYSHAEGDWSEASGESAHAEGNNTKASGNNSHAQNLGTIAQGNNQTAIGAYNIPDDKGLSAFIIGNGTGVNERSNVYTIDWDGNSVQAGTNTSTDFIIAEEEPISIKDELNNINDTIETIITDIDIINNDICGTADESDKIVPRIYELENRTRYLNIEDEETNNDAFYITDGNGKIILEVNENGVKSTDFMTEDGSLLPKSAGEDHKLTGPLGLTEGVMYGTTLPTEAFDGQLFFLEDDIFDIPQGGKAGQALVKKTDADGDIEWQDVSVPAANASTSGIVTTKGQVFAGCKRFTDGLVLESYTKDSQPIQMYKDINYGDTPTANIKTRINFEDKNGVAYGGIVHTITNDNKNRTSIINYSPKANRDGNTEFAQFYIDVKNDKTCVAGVVSGDGLANDIVFMGAAWNDYAEYRDQKEDIEPGYCVASTDNGQVYKTTEKFQACDGIVSDTFGFAIGQTDNCQTPLAVAGRVLAYCYGDKNDYHAGDTVCAGPEGKIIKMTREEIKEYPDRIIGIVSEIPKYETWGKGNIKVNNRIWIKVK